MMLMINVIVHIYNTIILHTTKILLLAKSQKYYIKQNKNKIPYRFGA